MQIIKENSFPLQWFISFSGLIFFYITMLSPSAVLFANFPLKNLISAVWHLAANLFLNVSFLWKASLLSNHAFFLCDTMIPIEEITHMKIKGLHSFSASIWRGNNQTFNAVILFIILTNIFFIYILIYCSTCFVLWCDLILT